MLKMVERPAMYQGHIPITETGGKCEVCGMEWWPRWPGCNDGCHPGRHLHVEPKKEEPKKELSTFDPDDWDF